MGPKVSPARANSNDALATAERTHAADTHRPGARPRRIGRLRLPIALTARPWATLYEMPDGTRLWCVRLWEEDRAVRRCFRTSYLVAFARINRLDALRAEIEEIARRT